MDFLDFLDAGSWLTSGESGLLSSLFSILPEATIEGLSQLEGMEQLYFEKTGQTINYAELFSTNDIQVASTASLNVPIENVEFPTSVDQQHLASDIETSQASHHSNAENHEPTGAEKRANYIVSTAANLTAMGVIQNAPDIVKNLKALITNAKHLWKIDKDVSSNAPDTRQNNPVKNEMMGVTDSQAPLVNKVKRLTIYEPLMRVELRVDADPYFTEIQSQAILPKTATNEAGTLHKPSNLWSKILRTTLFVMARHEGEVEGLVFCTLDFPNPQLRGKNLYTRLRKYVGSDEIRYYKILQSLPYAMEPIFPRLVFKDGRVEEIPDSWRLEIMKLLREDTKYDNTNKWLKIFDKKKPYFTKRERRLMLAHLKVESMEFSDDRREKQEIRKIMAVNTFKEELAQETVREIWKAIHNKSMVAFKTQFLPKALTVYYWLEMGLYIDPVD